MKTMALKTPSIQFTDRVMTGAEMAARWPVDVIAARGDGVVRSIAGASRVQLRFDPKRSEIEIQIGNQRAVVYKDELLYFARFAKGAQAI